jgi:hypothetical protein
MAAGTPCDHRWVRRTNGGDDHLYARGCRRFVTIFPISQDCLQGSFEQARGGVGAKANMISGRQRGFQQSLAMVLAIAIELVVESAQIGFDGKLGIEHEHAANMPGGAGLIAKHGRTRRKESIVELVGATNAP